MQSEAMSEKRGGGKRTETPSERWGTVARERRNLPLTAGKSKKKDGAQPKGWALIDFSSIKGQIICICLDVLRPLQESKGAKCFFTE